MNTRSNINDAIRKKFESFEPTPPPHVWDNIEKGINSNKPLLPVGKKWIAGSLLLILSLSYVILFDPFDILSNQSENIPAIESELESNIPEKQAEVKEINVVEETKGNPDNSYNNITKQNIDNSSNSSNQKASQHHEINKYDSDFGSGYIGSVGMKHSDFIIADIETPGMDELEMPDNIDEKESDLAIEIESAEKKQDRWSFGINIWPELTISNIDSVEVLNSYSLNIEPTYFFNDHLFIRSGFGASYTRDRGYAEIKYYVKEFIGTYEDVYDVTFDSIDGVAVPTFHTKTVEVWDSIKHISISNVTNKYLFLNVPLLFGYSSGDETKKINWHVFAGPVLYFNAINWIQEPSISDTEAEIVELHNNLPVRNNFYLQLWIGAGINYQINNKLSINFEPGYYHYLTDVYKNKNLSSPTSGFGLRLGLQLKLK